MKFSVGQRVVVHPDEGWTVAARGCLGGLVGEVEEVQTERGMAHVPCERYLVTFPDRPRAWSANQVPSHSWWFEAHELEEDRS